MSYIQNLRKYVGHDEILSVGATILVVKENKILLQLRSDTRTWGIPGGAIELGETLEETASRELKEETGLVATKFQLLNVFSGPEFLFTYPNKDKVYTVPVLYKAIDVSGNLSMNDKESLELKYFSLDEIPECEPRAYHILSWMKENKIV